MNTNNRIPYLLLYAATIDTEITENEKKLIRERVGSDGEWKQLVDEFEKDNEFVRLEKVDAILKDYPSPNERSQLLKIVRQLMEADEEFSMMERYLLRLMERY